MQENCRLSLSIVIPAYNEERTILEVLRSISSCTPQYVDKEVIVVNDGSSDSTVDVLKNNPHLFDKLISLEKNQGKGAAVRRGLQEASGEYILFQDADLEYDPSHYTDLIKPVQTFDADLVIGSRLIGGTYTRVHYFWHKVGNKFITLIFNLLNNTTFTDIYSCYVLFRRKLLNPYQLKTNGWQQQAEILTKVVNNSSSKVWFEVPIGYNGRTYEQGKKIRAHHTASVIYSIVVFALLARIKR